MRVCIAILIVFALQSCTSKEVKMRQLEGSAFGTTYTILFFGEVREELAVCVDSTIAAVNRSVSTYMEQSDISRINSGENGVGVDQTFKDVFRLSKAVHRQSQGYFDPTVGILRNAYGFGQDAPLAEMDSTTLDSLRQFVGLDKVRLTESGMVEMDRPGIYLDFNAVAKGYGIDRIGDCLDGLGVEHFLIELGGELLARGINLQKAKPWTVGVEEVGSERLSRSYSEVVALRDAAMASSGNYRKFRIDSLSGTKYVHTIDPLTGRAEESDVTSATVIAPSCAMADAYATAFMAMGFERSRELLTARPELHAHLTWIDEAGQSQVFMTPGFKVMLAE